MDTRSGSRDWMFAEAVQMLARREQLCRQLFQLGPSRVAVWEPPVDVLETHDEVVVLVALPGVAPDQVDVLMQDGVMTIAGRRMLPSALRGAIIHRMELPQGRFERRIAIPAGRYEAASRLAIDGCIMIALRKSPDAGGVR